MANDLIPAQVPSWRTLSPGLKSLLTDGERSDDPVRTIVANPALREECRALLPTLQRELQSAEPGPLNTELVRQALVLGIPDRSHEEWADLLSIYHTLLGHLPEEVLKEAFKRWHRGELYPKEVGRHAFYPKPAELLSLAEKPLTDLRIAAYRAKKAIEYVEKSGTEWTPERKAAERQKMIDAGYLNPDGTPNMSLKGRDWPRDDTPRQSPHEVAEALRRSDAQARHGGAPNNRAHMVADPGDVI